MGRTQLPTDRSAAIWTCRGSDLPKVPESQWPGGCSFYSRALCSWRVRNRDMDTHVNRLRLKEAPEKELSDRSFQPGPLVPPTHTHLGCPARRVSSELSPAWMAGRHGDMDSKAISSEEVGLESGCRQTGLDFAISSRWASAWANSGPGWKLSNCDVPWCLPGLRT